MRRYRWWGALGAAFLVSAMGATAAQAAKEESLASVAQQAVSQRRGLTVRDVFNAESIGRSYGGSVAYSADGRDLALVRLRPAASKKDYSLDYFYDNDRGDVWVMTRGGALENITNGAQDGSGWWAPQWSPDGRYLAMLSTRGAERAGDVSIWVWELSSRALRPVTDTRVAVGSGNLVAHAHPYRWWDSEHILYSLLAPRESNADHEQAARRVAGADWVRAAKGKEVTANILESGSVSATEVGEKRKLIRVNVGSADQQQLVQGATLSWQPSPTRTYVSFARRVGSYKPAAGELLLDASEQYAVDVASNAGKLMLSSQGVAADLIAGTIRWSKSGKQLAFLSYAQPRTESPELVVMDLDKLQVRKIDLRGLDLSPAPLTQRLTNEWMTDFEWLESGDFLVRGAERTKHGAATEGDRRDWWRVSLTGVRTNVTRGIEHVPVKIWRRQRDDVFVGLGGGKLWLLDPLRASARPLQISLKEPVQEIVWPAQFSGDVMQYAPVGERYSKIYIQTVDGRGGLYEVDLDSEQATSIPLPEQGVRFMATSHASQELLLFRNDFEGVKVWRSKKGNMELLFHANEYLNEIAPAKLRKVEYVSLDGAALTGWILLPANYVEGRRYPLITSVYATLVLRDVPPVRRLGVHSEEIAAGRGYAVLIPSMPAGDGTDPMLELPSGVLPAVDKAIEMGIADPQRLFLMGVSWGGFSTNGLITQTRRFAAAASLAGPSNFESIYGDFWPNVRYASTLDTFEGKSVALELMLGGTPWTNRAGYVRNSPVTYVDRVQTPLLLLHGDLDFIAIQQAEQLFYALHRQGKPARFVRYLGEGHIPASPANAEHMWEQIFNWFERAGARGSRATN